MKRKMLLCALLPLLPACSGADIDSNDPGELTRLEDGSLAVDARTEKIFVLQTLYEETSTPAPSDEATPADTPVEADIASRDLYAIDPDSGALTNLGGVTDIEDLSILFPKDSVLVMGSRDGQTVVQTYDSSTLELKYEASPDLPDAGVELSADGTYFSSVRWPEWDEEGVLTTSGAVFLFNVATTEVRSLELGGCVPSVGWFNTTEGLITVLSCYTGSEDDPPTMRLLSWSLENLEANDFATDAQGLWSGATLDIMLPGVEPDASLLLGRVDISPDDRVAALPLFRYDQEEAESSEAESSSSEGSSSASSEDTNGTSPELQIVDLADGTVRIIVEARGPVGFTPDGTTIVSYTEIDVTDDSGDTEQLEALLLIDVGTLATETVEVPTEDYLRYYVTAAGNFVVIDTAEYYVSDDEDASPEDLIVYDVDNGELVQISDSKVDLDEFVSRTGHDELWLVDGGLYRLDYVAAALEAVPLAWTPSHIAYLPARDRLVLDDGSSSTISLFDPTSRTITLSVTLPGAEGADQ